MSNPVFEVWVDEESQIIRHRLHQEPSLEDFKRLVEETDECAQNLRDPSSISILVDGNWFGRMKKPVRTLAMEVLQKKPIVRFAVVNPNRVVRVVVRFAHTALGINKIRVFEDEASARNWLLS